jgi:hypothetical protein
MNKIITLILLSISSVSFAQVDIPLDLRVNNFYEALMMSFEQKFRAKELLNPWNKEELEYSNIHRTDEKGGCYTKSPGEVLLVLRIEADGKVSGAYTSKDNAKAKCFVEHHLGTKLPKPPMAPVYILKRMR